MLQLKNEIIMYVSFVLLLYIITLSGCLSQNITGRTLKKGVATITSHPIRRSRQSMGSGRLSLINYRFNRRPKRKHLDIQELKLVLGSSYDSKFMSIEQPAEFSKDAGATYVVRKDSWRYGEMLQELQASNLTQELQQMAGNKFTVEPEFVKTVEKWLLRRASCPVKYAWEDIGALFWPRYIRRGECSSESSTSCSWPSGMHCVPSGTTTVEILRWQCRTPKNKGRKKMYKGQLNKDYKEDDKPLHMKCSWVRVPYPITSECMCTC